MPVENLNFQGINRAASDYANSGACEELINLRPTTAGLVPVKPFSVKFPSVTDDKLYEHCAGNDKNYIGITVDSGTLTFTFVDDEGNPIQESIDESVGADCTLNDIHYASAGNYFLISIANRANEVYKNLCFLWNGTEYEPKEADVPNVAVTVDLNGVDNAELEKLPYDAGDANPSGFVDGLNSVLNQIQEEHDKTCFGPIVIATAFKTNDGNTFWTGIWEIYDPVPLIQSLHGDEGANDTSFAREATDLFDHSAYSQPRTYGTIYNSYFTIYDKAYSVASAKYARLSGVKLDLTVKLSNASRWDEETSVLKSVEIYVSRPKLYFDTSVLLSTENGLEYGDYHAQRDGALTGNSDCIVPPLKNEDMKLDNQLLYLQKSIPLSELKNAGDDGITELMEFGGAKQTTSKTLDVDAGQVTRYGNLLSYNARFHFYDSVSMTGVSKPYFFHKTDTLRANNLFVIYNNGKVDKFLYVGDSAIPDDVEYVIASSLRIKEVWRLRESSPGATKPYHLTKYFMEESKTYNYSINMKGPYYDEDENYAQIEDLYEMAQADPIQYVLDEEPDAINVTEQYNPFVFKVEHSYLAPGKVLDLQPQIVAVADISIGDSPLDVFTNRGVYALLQGNGNVLYGAMRPVSNLVSTKNSAPTESGTFFIAAGGLWCVVGLKAVLISDALHLGPHRYLRHSPGYQAIAYSEGIEDDILSRVIFEKYLENAKLAYNRYRDELFVSNPDYDYSYVLSLKYRQWFKMSLKLSQDVVGADVANIPITGGMSIVDFADETEETSVQVHLQSRPFSIGYQYVHIHRLIAMIRASLSGNDLLIVSLYGSDDLQNWNLLAYADRKNVQLSQIRTPSAARSWRYYTVCIGGTTPTETDFGTVMFEYEPVVRRIG